MHGRIIFAGNPWPAGHPIDKVRLAASLTQAHGVGLLLHLETADYDSEGPGEERGEDDWASPIVWGNFHACTLSNLEWGYLPADLPRLDAGRPFAVESLAGRRLDLDPVTALKDDWSPQDRAFQTYLLGHDAVAEHSLVFAAGSGPDLFNIGWSGRIALAYVGDYEFRHRFAAELVDVPFEGFELERLPGGETLRAAEAGRLARAFLADPDAWVFLSGEAPGAPDRLIRRRHTLDT